jgi:hypothetical protein
MAWPAMRGPGRAYPETGPPGPPGLLDSLRQMKLCVQEIVREPGYVFLILILHDYNMMVLRDMVLEFSNRSTCKENLYTTLGFLRAKLAEQLYDSASVVFHRFVHRVKNKIQWFR